MNKITAEWCGYLLKDLQRQSITGCGIGKPQECYLQALEIALPILEQQERGEGEWIEWKGGECPVTEKSFVLVRYRGDFQDDKCIAGNMMWEHSGEEEDIIAYRIIPERDNNQNGEQ